MVKEKGILIFRVNTVVKCLGRTVVRDCGLTWVSPYSIFTFTLKCI